MKRLYHSFNHLVLLLGLGTGRTFEVEVEHGFSHP